MRSCGSIDFEQAGHFSKNNWANPATTATAPAMSAIRPCISGGKDSLKSDMTAITDSGR